jgi:hypothetical protein
MLMSEVKTVTHEGNVYEIGKDYLFSSNELDWTYSKLTDIDGGYERVFCTQENEWRHIKEIPALRTRGTITPAPIELINGSAYMFEWAGKIGISGIYSGANARFYLGGGGVREISSCTNIRLLTVEKK